MTPEEVNIAVAELRKDVKAIFRRIDEQLRLAESVHELAASVKVMATEMEYMRVEQQRMREDIDEMKNKPGKRWDLIVLGMINAAVAAFMAYVFK
jgi:fructose-1,6-bisphosphatase/sedoheptulose 1,7-bisphosphatase-like protein